MSLHLLVCHLLSHCLYLSFSKSDNTANIVARIISEFQEMLTHHPGRLTDFVLSLTKLTPNLTSSELFEKVLLLLNSPEFLELCSYAVNLYVSCMTFHNCFATGPNNQYTSLYAALEWLMHDDRHANAIARPSWLYGLVHAARTSEELNMISCTIVWPMFKNICLLVHYVKDLDCACSLFDSCPSLYDRTRMSSAGMILLQKCKVHCNDKDSQLTWLLPPKTIPTGLPAAEDHYNMNTDGFEGPSTTLSVSVTHFFSMECTSVVPNHSIGQQTAKVYASTTPEKPHVRLSLPGSDQHLKLLYDQPTASYSADEPVCDRRSGGFRDADGVGVLVPSHFSILERHQDMSTVRMSEELLTTAFQSLYGARPFHYMQDEHKKKRCVLNTSGSHMSTGMVNLGVLCDSYMRHSTATNTIAADSIACELAPYCSALNASIRNSKNPLKYLAPVRDKTQAVLYSVALDSYIREGIIAQEAFDLSVNGRLAISKLNEESQEVTQEYLNQKDSVGNHDPRETVDVQRKIADLACVKLHISEGHLQAGKPTPLDFPDLYDAKDKLTQKMLSKISKKTVRPPTTATPRRRSARLYAKSTNSEL